MTAEPNRLHNNPPEPAELYRAKVEAFAVSAKALPAVDDDNQGQYRDLIGYGGELTKEIEAQHKTEKAPHLEAGRKVDAAYKPLAEDVEDTRKTLKASLGAFVAEQERQAQAAARAAREAAEKAIRDAEEAKRAAEAEADDPLSVFDDPNEPAPPVDVAGAVAEAHVADLEAKAVGRVASDAGGFAALGLKTKWSAKVTDPVKLAEHYAKAGNYDLMALLQKLADADQRKSKGTALLPGAEAVSVREF